MDLVLETDGERTELMEAQQKLSESDDPNAAERLAQIFTRLE